MPRSFQIRSRWRIALFALVLLVPSAFVDRQVDAQKRSTAHSGELLAKPARQVTLKKNLMKLTASATAEGSNITIISDLPLNDYSAYRGGDRFYVLIPGADATRIVAGLKGQGFSDVRAQKKGDDVLLSFRLLAGSAARVSQKFNRLEIIVTVPSLVAKNSNAGTESSNTGTGNSNTGSQTDQSRGSGNTGGGGTGSRSRSGSGSSNRGSGGADTGGTASYGTTSPGQNPIATNPDVNTAPDGIPVGPDGRVDPQGTNAYPPYTEASPYPSPSPAPSVDQIAQLQPTPGIQSADVPPATTDVAPASGSTFGAQLKQNWLFILLAVVVAGLIAWVIFARSRGDQTVVENHLGVTPEPRAAAKAIASPIAVKTPTKTATKPPVVEAPSSVAENLVAPALVAAVVADETREEPVEEILEKEVEPEKPVAAEQASGDVAHLLAGETYDEASIATEHPAARQIVAAELLAALSGRNILRHERARKAFIKHGYFDDATRTLRTAESPGERASAARSLGLVRDESGTPHLIAALEDPSPDVRRAAVESLAEVRDPSAVAALEGLRDREKNRKVPTALIQHAIEASVVGKAKVEPPATLEPVHVSLPPPVDVEPRIADLEPAIEPTIQAPDEPAQSLLDAVELPSAAESEFDDVLEVPEAASLETSAPLSEHEIAGHELGLETEELSYGEVSLDKSDVLDVPETPEEFVIDAKESDANEWVDFDVSKPISNELPPPVTPTDGIQEVHLKDSSTQAPVLETPDDVIEAPVESAAGSDEPLSLPFTAAEAAIVAGSATEDERGLDVSKTSDKGIDVTGASDREIDVAGASEREIDVAGGHSSRVASAVLQGLTSDDPALRAASIEELGRVGGEDSLADVSAAFDDPSEDVRNAAARALFNLNPDRAGSFTQALREASPERRRNIGAALSTSGLATEAIGNLMGESREKTYDAFSLLFLMAKAGEVQPLMRAVEEHPNNEVRLAVVKLLALSGQQEILPAFRRLAVRGSLPTEVRSAVMEAIYQISSQTSGASS